MQQSPQRHLGHPSTRKPANPSPSPPPPAARPLPPALPLPLPPQDLLADNGALAEAMGLAKMSRIEWVNQQARLLQANKDRWVGGHWPCVCVWGGGLLLLLLSGCVIDCRQAGEGTALARFL